MQINYDRRDEIQRKQYDLLKQCLYSCKGMDKTCESYTKINGNGCAWYKVVLNDIEKIKNNNHKYTTFPILEKILENEKMY